MRHLLLISLFLTLLSGVAFAQDRYPFQEPAQRQQFERLTNNIRCMVCQNENLAASTSGFSRDMRSEIYKMVKEGKSDKQIISYMTQRYGYFISFDPPFNWETYLLWLAPLLLIVIGFFVGRSVYRKYRGT